MSEFTNLVANTLPKEYIIVGAVTIGVIGASIFLCKKLKNYSQSFGGRWTWPGFPGGMTLTAREHKELMNKFFPEKQKFTKDPFCKEKDKK